MFVQLDTFGFLVVAGGGALLGAIAFGLIAFDDLSSQCPQGQSFFIAVGRFSQKPKLAIFLQDLLMSLQTEFGVEQRLHVLGQVLIISDFFVSHQPLALWVKQSLLVSEQGSQNPQVFLHLLSN